MNSLIAYITCTILIICISFQDNYSQINLCAEINNWKKHEIFLLVLAFLFWPLMIPFAIILIIIELYYSIKDRFDK